MVRYRKPVERSEDIIDRRFDNTSRQEVLAKMKEQARLRQAAIDAVNKALKQRHRGPSYGSTRKF